MKQLVMIMVLLGVLQCGAGEIVVLTDTPVVEFSLPDGSVLANAYVWRKSSQGLMIMHDGGSYFLNFKLLPDDWKAVYMASSDEEDLGGVPPSKPEVKAGVPVRDRYQAAEMLAQIPGLEVAAQAVLLGAESSGIADQNLLMLGVLHNLFLGNRKEAKRFNLFVEEKEYELENVEVEQFFKPCVNCGGDGLLSHECRRCSGAGKCPKCKGAGTLKASFKGTLLDCTLCRGTGECLACKGLGSFSSTCPKCRGSGNQIHQLYCEVLRDRIVREVNTSAVTNRGFSIVQSSSSRMESVLAEFPSLKTEAQAFYLSEEYRGGMDTNLVVAGLLHSLLKEDYGEVRRYRIMLTVLFPESEVIDSSKYLKSCSKCDATGWISRDCRSCKDEGKCARCAGEGERTLEIGESKIYCTTCGGSGKCPDCQGKGVLPVKCKACKGQGRRLERQRTEIKLGILEERLNEFYDRR